MKTRLAVIALGVMLLGAGVLLVGWDSGTALASDHDEPITGVGGDVPPTIEEQVVEESADVDATDPATEPTNGDGFVQTQTEPDDPATEDDEPGRRGRRGHRGGKHLAAVAEVTGLEVAELRELLADGTTTVAEAAASAGVDRQTLVNALVDDAEERIAAKVAEGDLTQEEAAEKLAERAESIATFVDSPYEGCNRDRGQREEVTEA